MPDIDNWTKEQAIAYLQDAEKNFVKAQNALMRAQSFYLQSRGWIIECGTMTPAVKAIEGQRICDLPYYTIVEALEIQKIEDEYCPLTKDCPLTKE